MSFIGDTFLFITGANILTDKSNVPVDSAIRAFKRGGKHKASLIT